MSGTQNLVEAWGVLDHVKTCFCSSYGHFLARRTTFLLEAAGALLVPAAKPFAAGAPNNDPLKVGARAGEACPKAGAA